MLIAAAKRFLPRSIFPVGLGHTEVEGWIDFNAGLATSLAEHGGFKLESSAWEEIEIGGEG